MKAVTDELYDLILELQSFNSLQSFALAGGTNLALRYNHRISFDIDMFSDKLIGEEGMKLIRDELKQFYKNDFKFAEIINVESGGQFCFLRMLIIKNGANIKVELIQNVQHLDPLEIHNKIKLFSEKDIGLFKLLSASNRKAKKDIYDLDFITEEIHLSELLNFLEIKSKKFNDSSCKNLFDLDDELSPLNDLALLLEFDNIEYTSLPRRPSHSTDRIDIMDQSKPWVLARSSWKRKVLQVMRERGFALPPVKPIN